MSRFIVVDKSAVIFENEMAMVKFPDHQRALDTIHRVRQLHKPFPMYPDTFLCDHCWDASAEDYYKYPCPTIKALDGETE